MPRGGARINSGPPPSPDALRRERPSDKAGWRTLPAEGYRGPVPDWPLATLSVPGDKDGLASIAFAERELELWEQNWRLPQADMWAERHAAHDVALYVRCLALAEQGSTEATREARQWSDRLGLNDAALLRNRWRIAAAAVEDEPAGKVKAKASRKSSRDRRLTVIQGDAGAT